MDPLDHDSPGSPLNLSNASSNENQIPLDVDFSITVGSFVANMKTIATSMNASLGRKSVPPNGPGYASIKEQTLKSFLKITVDPSGIKQEHEEIVNDDEPDDAENTEDQEDIEESSPEDEIIPEKFEQLSNTGNKQQLGNAARSEKPIILCGKCDKSLLDIPSFLEHCQEHGDENVPLKCAICGPSSKLLKSPYTLKKHQRYLHNMSKLKCPHCSKVFCPNYYNRHVKTAHLGAIKFDCHVCKKTLHTRKGYKAHMENHFPEETNHYTCPICKKSIRESYLAKHLRYHQLDESFMCEICGIVMHNRGNFVYHQETHKTGKNRHLCEICGKSYKTNRVLKKHYSIHTGVSKVKCTICDAVLSNLHSLKTHLKTHQEDRPFQCKFCGKGFKHPGHRTAHQRIHTGERPYQCKICPSAFYEAGNLTKHMKKVHSNGKTSNKKFKFGTLNSVDTDATESYADFDSLQEYRDGIEDQVSPMGSRITL